MIAPTLSATDGEGSRHRHVDVRIPPLGLPGLLRMPEMAAGLIIFAHGSGSSRFSPRNNHVADALGRAGFATLLFDLLLSDEEADRRNVFDIPVLARRVCHAIDWAAAASLVTGLPIGLFGASTGSAAALSAAAERPESVAAIVSRGGRPDLALAVLDKVEAPTLLLVGSRDGEVLRLNQLAYARLRQPKRLQVIAGASHLFTEPGTLDMVINAATGWFRRFCTRPEDGKGSG
ncbi:alpha/beta family hydrolase [Maricaulis sp.]|uniref:dienelactone hydrolase family protein n=1 Tax=Maricaulis sp. TaxID=1486257 RepID=UPI0025C40182|nr:alpha/beta family hydrolase [Maricaulis sp.]